MNSMSRLGTALLGGLIFFGFDLSAGSTRYRGTPVDPDKAFPCVGSVALAPINRASSWEKFGFARANFSQLGRVDKLALLEIIVHLRIREIDAFIENELRFERDVDVRLALQNAEPIRNRISYFERGGLRQGLMNSVALNRDQFDAWTDEQKLDFTVLNYRRLHRADRSFVRDRLPKIRISGVSDLILDVDLWELTKR